MKAEAVGHLLRQLLQDHQFKALKLPSICSRLLRLKKKNLGSKGHFRHGIC